MWYDETIKNMAFQRDKVLGSCMTEDEEEAKMLNAILDELKLNALVITDPYNMRHVSGFRGGEGALYISAAQKVLMLHQPTDLPVVPAGKVIEQSFEIGGNQDIHRRGRGGIKRTVPVVHAGALL